MEVFCMNKASRFFPNKTKDAICSSDLKVSSFQGQNPIPGIVKRLSSENNPSNSTLWLFHSDRQSK